MLRFLLLVTSSGGLFLVPLITLPLSANFLHLSLDFLFADFFLTNARTCIEEMSVKLMSLDNTRFSDCHRDRWFRNQYPRYLQGLCQRRLVLSYHADLVFLWVACFYLSPHTPYSLIFIETLNHLTHVSLSAAHPDHGRMSYSRQYRCLTARVRTRSHVPGARQQRQEPRRP